MFHNPAEYLSSINDWLVIDVDGLPSLKLTYPLKIDPGKRRFLLETIIFRGELLVSGRVILGISSYERGDIVFRDLPLEDLPLTTPRCTAKVPCLRASGR